jgi:RNA polymerase sigma-70 factor (ECF subfamily)
LSIVKSALADEVIRAQRSETLEAVAEMMDEESFDAFYRLTAAPLRAYVVRVLGNATQADDIVHDAYLKLLRNPPATRDARELRSFVFRVASNLIADCWRRGRRERGALDERAAAPHASGPDVPLQVDMARLFEQLRPQQRQLMWLAYVEGADHREIAAALGLRERSVRVLLHRVRRKLAGLLLPSSRGPGESE